MSGSRPGRGVPAAGTVRFPILTSLPGNQVIRNLVSARLEEFHCAAMQRYVQRRGGGYGFFHDIHAFHVGERGGLNILALQQSVEHGHHLLIGEAVAVGELAYGLDWRGYRPHAFNRIWRDGRKCDIGQLGLHFCHLLRGESKDADRCQRAQLQRGSVQAGARACFGVTGRTAVLDRIDRVRKSGNKIVGLDVTRSENLLDDIFGCGTALAGSEFLAGQVLQGFHPGIRANYVELHRRTMHPQDAQLRRRIAGEFGQSFVRLIDCLECAQAEIDLAARKARQIIDRAPGRKHRYIDFVCRVGVDRLGSSHGIGVVNRTNCRRSISDAVGGKCALAQQQSSAQSSQSNDMLSHDSPPSF